MRLRPVGTAVLASALAIAGIAVSTGTAAADRGRNNSSDDRGIWKHGDGKHDKGGLEAVGLTDGGTKLVTFSINKPNRMSDGVAVTGLDGDHSLVGIDYRVQNGKLYGVGNSGGVYQVSDDAVATKVGQLSVALSGTFFGVDFNPAANALRVVSDNGQNLRQPFGTGDSTTGATVVDGALNTAGTPAIGITAAAYTNNDLSAETATTLFDIDTTGDQVMLQSPANSGTLVATGKLGVAADPDAGFDIYSTVRNDRAVDVTGYASLGVNGAYKLYEVDLLTGVTEYKGRFAKPVTDIALPLAQR